MNALAARASPDVTTFFERFVNGTLPMFVHNGWDDRRGGLVERLAPDLRPDGTPFRRSMLHGRQLYVYSVWGARLGDRAFAANADRIFEQLVDRFRDRDRGGWFEKTDLDGRPLSTDKVLYGHAFVLLGLTAYCWCLGRNAQEHVDATLDFIESRFRHGQGLYHTALDRAGAARGEGVDQNPLMHLLEALLFLFERSGHPEALDRAHPIVDRMQRSFLRDGLILEHLGRDLEPHPANGHLVEPGHQAEWAWLLEWYGRLAGNKDLEALGRNLVANAVGCGWDREHGGLFDQIDRTTGEAIATTKRLWPLCELTKAVCVFPGGVESIGMDVDAVVGLLCGSYLRADGTWSERLHRDMTVTDATMPASTCYHLSCALGEALGADRQ